MTAPICKLIYEPRNSRVQLTGFGEIIAFFVGRFLGRLFRR